MDANIRVIDEQIQEYYALMAEEYERENKYWQEIYEDSIADEIINENKNNYNL